MAIPNDRQYAVSHEWHKLDGDVLTLGITQFAVDELTDITFVEMQDPGTVLEAGDAAGEVESVKATSEIFSAIAGEVIEINSDLEEDPSLVNSDPFGAGWLCKIKVHTTDLPPDLLDASAYESKYAE